MRKIRRRLISVLLAFSGISSAVTILIFWLVSNNILLGQSDIRILIRGYALKELVILALAVAIVIIAIIFMSRRTADPIERLSRAANEIADGNYDIYLEEPDRKDELGKLFSDFNRMAQELKSNEILKKDFISNVSHEFKTPLAIMEGYAKLLTEDQKTDEQCRTYASLILEESHRLSAITGKMLRLSRLNSSNVPLNTAPYYLDEQIRQTIVLLEPSWSSRQLKLNLMLDPVKYAGDKELMSEVWFNLLENAIKFSPEGAALDIILRPYPKKILFIIRDYGIGMDENTQARIFEQFYQGDTSHRGEGSGLGLSIVKQIVELHGGKISVKSAPGEGSTFTVEL